MFRRVLIANRGEIALRIIRTLREMSITSIAAFSDADRSARFVQEADEAHYLGPAPPQESYLNIQAILEVAREAGAEAIHPGYGFLSENAAFARAVQEAGLTYIGPSAESIRLMGNKVEARRAVAALGVPVVPGTAEPVRSVAEALAFAGEVGYPIAVKAAGGGGGRGIRIVRDDAGMAEALEGAAREAAAYFNNPDVYLERYFPEPRHVEIQVLGDRLGHLVHLGERDCSVQRRHQKLIEETPSPAVDRGLRADMGEMAIRAAQAARYFGAGTVEFLLSDEGRFYFLEMNTRIQVEHPITEEVTGVDLIREMTLAAAGEPITIRDSVLDPRGHAMEVRINAEDPQHGFRPTPATVTAYREPGGIGVRVDSGIYPGFTIPQEYDSLMAKLIARAPDRDRARLRTLRALDEFQIAGPSSTIPFARAVLSHPTYIAGDATTTFVERHLGELVGRAAALERGVDLALPPSPQVSSRTFEVQVNRKLFRVRVAQAEQTGRSPRQERRTGRDSRVSADGNILASPMHGTVIGIKKRSGEPVNAGETIFVIEAMKMENEVAAHRSGTISAVNVQVGDAVDLGQELASIE